MSGIARRLGGAALFLALTAPVAFGRDDAKVVAEKARAVLKQHCQRCPYGRCLRYRAYFGCSSVSSDWLA